MTFQEAQDVFVKHNQFFELYAKDMYIPRGVETIINEITAAYKVINPHYMCTSCGNEMIIDANRYRLARIEELKNDPKRYTFPKQ